MTILRMMAVHDEVDVLPYNLDFYAEAGFPTVVVDNGSTDGSYELCRQYLRDGAIVALERLATDRYHWRRILKTLLALALRQRPEYLMLTAPDEFFEVAKGGDLRHTMEGDFAAGYNLIQLRNMEFQMTSRDDMSEPSPLARMRHYYYRHTAMLRAYPAVPGLRLRSPGHRPTFPEGVEDRPSPRGYVCRHYPLRTADQARHKIARVSYPPGSGRRNYARFLDGEPDYLTDARGLLEYKEDHRWKYSDPGVHARLRQTAHALLRLHEEYARLRVENAALRARLAAEQVGSEAGRPATSGRTWRPRSPRPRRSGSRA